jgi:HTH-type transcriptional regulator, glycine betaine synthesis regulator
MFTGTLFAHLLLNNSDEYAIFLPQPMKRNAILPLDEPRRNGAAPLNPVEVETIHLFVQLSRALGQPPSVAEIYGLLFVSPRPLPQDDFLDRLNLSKGSASQGLRYLLELGAARTVYVPGDRRVHYEAVAELRNLVGRFLRQQVLCYFEDSGERLERIAAEAKKLSGAEREHALVRLKTLKTWSKNAQRMLPLLLTLLGTRNGK